MIIRTLRPCEVAGRTVAAGLLLDLLESDAAALIDAGDAERPGGQPAAPADEPQHYAATPADEGE